MHPYYNLYRKYNVDIWGIFKTTLNLSSFYEAQNKRKPFDFKISKKVDWVNRFFYLKFKNKQKDFWSKRRRFIYRINFIDYKRKKRKFVKQILTISLIQLFYLVLRQDHFRKIAIKAKKKDGFYERNYIWLLEGRIVSVIYRLNFISNMFESIIFVKLGLIYINKTRIFHINYLVPLMMFIRFHPLIKGTIFWILFKRIRRRAILNCKPTYIYLSYFFLTFFFKRLPHTKEIINPFNLDIYRAAGFNR